MDHESLSVTQTGSKPRHSARLRWIRRPDFILLPIASVIIPLMMISAGGLLTWRTTWQDATLQLGRTANATAEYASRVLSGYVVAAGRINDIVGSLTDDEIRQREPELHRALAQLVTELPQAQEGFVLNRQGRPLVAARVFPVPRDGAGASEPDFFQALARAPAPTMQVS